MSRILIVEDEPDLLEVLRYNVRQAGHEALCSTRAEQALQLARERPPDLVLLDWMLPDRPGLELCAALRRDARLASVPVIFLTARGSEADRIAGLQAGADDYVVKPFSVRELLLRMSAVLRRNANVSAGDAGRTVGSLRLEPDTHRVLVEERPVELTALEFRLLATLVERGERVQSREALLDAVWGLDAEVGERTVDASVKRLREKLGAAGSYIETIRGVGYRLAAPAGESR